MISITTPIFNLSAPLELAEHRGSSDTESIVRRVTRTATLDGGAVLSDGGYSDSDRNVTIVFPRVTKTDLDTLKTWVQTYAELWVGLRDGCFAAGVPSLSYSRGAVRMTLLIKGKQGA